MPALVKSRVGSLRGTSGEDGTTAWPRWAKKSRNPVRTSLRLFMEPVVTGPKSLVTPAKKRACVAQKQKAPLLRGTPSAEELDPAARLDSNLSHQGFSAYSSSS